MTRARMPSDPCDLLRGVGEEPVPEQAMERVALRLQSTLAQVGPAELLANAATSGRTLPGSGVSTRWPWSPALTLPAVFIAGVGAAVVGLQAVRGDVTESSAPVVPPSALVSAAPELELPLVTPPRVEAPAPLASSSAPLRVVSSPASRLAGERSLLDRARSRMAAGEAEAALAVLTQHARSYPRGLLAEEREAMTINVLVALGRAEEAERRGRVFRQRFPASLVRRSVDAALATLPKRASE